MRVIAGKAKGKTLKFPKLSKERNVRPLMDRAKEALFNILGAKVEDCYFLDLFAGTGGVGIEALSRGARIAIFVEKDKKVVETIRENLGNTNLYEFAEIYSLDVLRAIKILSSKGIKFDIIFVGAPYDSFILEKSLGLLTKVELLCENGLIVAEHRHKQVLSEKYGALVRFRESKYGETAFSFYRKDFIA